MNTSSKRIQWRCRRGMLELDILLQNFLKQKFFELSYVEKKTFEYLLEESDNDLHSWLTGKSLNSNDDYASIIEKIISSHNRFN